MTLLSAAMLLFLVMDPLGNIPLYLTALKNVEAKRQKKVIIRELIIALAVLTLFLFSGRYILDLLQISEPALSIAGAVILVLIAIKMIFPPPEDPYLEHSGSEPLVVPLAIPYVAGPSAMATVLLIVSREPSRWAEWFAALLIAWSASGIILCFSTGFRKILGKRGLIAIERLMGMVLTTIAVQMLLSGISQFLKTV